VDPVVRDPAATVVQAVEVAAWAAVVLPAAKAVVEVAPPAAVAAADRVVAAVVRPEVEAADKVVAVKVVEVVVAVRPEAVAEAAETVSTSHLSGASRSRGAPFFY